MLSESKEIAFFKDNQAFLQKFKKDLNAFLELQHYRMELSDEAIEQLRLQLGNAYVTPEARDPSRYTTLNFEIQRGLTRLYSIELLLRGEQKDYDEFVQAQTNKLSKQDFDRLSQEIKTFDPPTLAVIKAGCLIVISDQLKANIAKHQISPLPEDSEEFLSELSILLQKNKTLCPITKDFSQEQLELVTKMFWPRFHMRHIFSTEGANNMTATFARGVQEGVFTQQDFMVWKWRWLSNCFGFDSGPGAKFYDAKKHEIFMLATEELNKTFNNPEYIFLPNYLLRNAELLGLNSEQKEDGEYYQLARMFLGHLVAFTRYYHVVDIKTPEMQKAFLDGYHHFKEICPAQSVWLPFNYFNSCKDPESRTPTYLPGAMNNVLLIMKDDFALDPATAYQYTITFMCQLMYAIYYHGVRQLIQGKDFATKSNLVPLVKAWCENPETIQFVFDENNKLSGECEAVSLEPAAGLRL